MMFPTSSALLADELGMPDAAAYDLLAGCTGFVYAIAQAYGMIAGGLAQKARRRRRRALEDPRLGGPLDARPLRRRAGAVVLEPVDEGGFLGFELGADGGGGENLWPPGSGSRHFEDPDGLVKMNGREVFKFATRVMVSSAEKILAECDVSVDDVDVYVPHQANKRIIDHAARKLGIPEEKSSSTSTATATPRRGRSCSRSPTPRRTDGCEGELVLMTGMGAGLTWGSALIEWTNGRAA